MHERVIETPMVVKDGYLELPEGPGLGLGNFVDEAIDELGRKVWRGLPAMTERIKKVVVTWSGYRDRILERSKTRGI